MDQDTSFIQWLKKYRKSSLLHNINAMPALTLEELGQSVRYFCVSIISNYEAEMFSNAIAQLNASMAGVADACGADDAFLTTDGLDGSHWSFLIRRMNDRAHLDIQRVDVFEAKDVFVDPDGFNKHPAVPAALMGHDWERAMECAPWIFKHSDEDLGAMAKGILLSIQNKTDDISYLADCVQYGVMVLLAMEHMEATTAANSISSLINNGVAIGDWALFISKTGDFDKMIADMEDAIRSA